MPINPGRILYSSHHVLAVNKLGGELVVKGAGRIDSLPLLDFLKKEYPGLRPLSRLDFETSGIVLFARTKIAFEALRKTWPQVRKTYRTIVVGHLHKKEGDINTALPARSGDEFTDAHTHYSVLREFPLCTYLEVEITTGRHHQIRRHLAGIGHPVELDEVYGEKKANRVFVAVTKYRRFFLHASEITFPDPETGAPIKVECPLPKPFADVLKKLAEM